MLNPDTRVAVCCYAGDQHQVVAALDLYLHHECPVVILSPNDSRAEINHPGVENRFAGKRAYIGQDLLDRQREHLRILLTFPEQFFLINDFDSICLSPKIPDYLYAEPDMLWSNLVIDNMPVRQTGHYPAGFPKLAFQPPYFISRGTLEKLLATVTDENIPANPMLSFIDHYMVQLAVKASVPWRGFPQGISAPISSDQNSARLAWDAVCNGIIMIHSVKAPAFWEPLVAARKIYLGEISASHNPFASRPFPPAPKRPPPQPLAQAYTRHRVDVMRAREIQLQRRGLKA